MAIQIKRSDEDEESSIVAEINITPLTDIFLVLLIIFMVTTTVANQLGVSVNLPAASQKTTEAQPEGVIVTLLPNGTVQLNGQTVSLGKDLGEALKTAFSKTKSRLVILEGDRQAFLGSAIEVMDQCRQAGAQSFAIATQPN
ncbi:MAG: biopolymer transporter ExbD [Bdellovibrionales bacterium]|nr:biopolymer transporter ExbD [Bdellovibrionales bacterium]